MIPTCYRTLPVALFALLATPALADSPGLSLSGDARMGVVWESDRALGPAERGLRLSSRARLRLQFRGETDGGLQFGADLRLDEATQRPAGGSVSIGSPSSGGRLTVGN